MIREWRGGGGSQFGRLEEKPSPLSTLCFTLLAVLRQANHRCDTFQLFVAARVAMGVALGGTWPAMHAITGAEPSSGHFVNKLQKSRAILQSFCGSTASHVLINIYMQIRF